MIKDGIVTNATAREIGVDAQTALVVEDGVGTKMGKGTVYFLQGVGQPAVCEPKQLLSFYNVAVQRLKAGVNFDLNNWMPGKSSTLSLEAAAQRLSVLKGTLANWVKAAGRGSTASTSSVPGRRSAAELEAENAK